MGFLDMSEDVFSQAVDQLTGNEPAVAATRCEIQCFIDGLPALRQAVRDDWPSEDEREEFIGNLAETPSATCPEAYSSRTHA